MHGAGHAWGWRFCRAPFKPAIAPWQNISGAIRGTAPETEKACGAITICRMKAFLIATLLLVTACSDGLDSSPAVHDLSPGIVESVEQVELGTPAPADPDVGDDYAEPRFGDQIVVRLEDGRAVILVYTGERHFQAGQRVRVHVSDLGVFLL